MENSSNKIEIKPIGSYLKVDENGYLENPASSEKIQEIWKPLIEDVVELYKKQFAEHLICVYIRGSVAKGEAVKGVSDLDSFAYVDIAQDQIPKGWQKEGKILLKDKYPFAEDIEITVIEKPEIGGIMVGQSVCVYGDPLKVEPRKPGKEMINHLYHIEERYSNTQKWLENISTEDKEAIKAKCTWLMKDILRAGFELTMERSKRYTRDLYLCYKDFAEYYPDKESLMREVLDLALNPTTNKEKILEIKNQIGNFISEESKKFV